MKLGSLNQKKIGIAILAISTLVAASFAIPARTQSALQGGIQAAGEVIKIYTSLNPPQTGQARVVNASSYEITVRSYNNNDWARWIAAGQLNLNPGEQGYITAATNPITVLWKKGRYGAVTGFGTENLKSTTLSKDGNQVLVIGNNNLPR